MNNVVRPHNSCDYEELALNKLEPGTKEYKLWCQSSEAGVVALKLLQIRSKIVRSWLYME